MRRAPRCFSNGVGARIHFGLRSLLVLVGGCGCCSCASLASLMLVVVVVVVVVVVAIFVNSVFRELAKYVWLFKAFFYYTRAAAAVAEFKRARPPSPQGTP
jgi:hypothetical protein